MTSTPPLPDPTLNDAIGVVGRGPLVRGIVAELEQSGRQVQAFLTAPEGEDLARLGCLILADDDDDGNVGTALRAREEHPALPLVVRVFDPVLEQYLADTSPDISILSMSAVATPDLVQLIGDTRAARLSFTAWLAGFSGKLDRLVLAGVLLVLALALTGTLFFAASMDLAYTDSFYFVVATITTTGYGDISPKDHPAHVKLAAAAFMLFGTATFATFFAVVSEWVFARRLDLVLGRVPTRWSNHVVLVGAGNITSRIAARLLAQGEHALVVEQDADNALVPVLRAQGHHVVIADATKEASLRLAGVERASSVVVLTERDALNLHIALVARSISPRATVCARIDSPLLARHVTGHSRIRATSPLLTAAKAFADEALKLEGDAQKSLRPVPS